ncbi:hypothetical protein E2C01_066616 [Portunus trituberculatus]|uniref:Uncharacterized protein n=1 Tax=Portunus trituberculatus TaxID=210409 RepID=A0A5B7HRG0_PORTR|nr:hypothetical protein [Portunus trituberculatus]
MHTPSQPAQPRLPTPLPLFHLKGNTYTVYVDKLKDCFEVDHLPSSATTYCLLAYFQCLFMMFRISEVLFCNGGTNLISHKDQKFFSNCRGRGQISQDTPPRQCNVGRLPGHGQHGQSTPLANKNTPEGLVSLPKQQAVRQEAAPSGVGHDPHSHQSLTLTQLVGTHPHAPKPEQWAHIQNPSSGHRECLGTMALQHCLLRLDGRSRATVRNTRYIHPLSCQSPEWERQELLNHSPQA